MKIYNKLIILLAIFGIAFSANAQQRVNDQRTNETKIADTAMQLPAKDTETLNRLMRELIRLDNVIPNLASKLLPPGQGDDSQLRAAISGLAFYASQENNPAEKKKIAGELCKAIPTVESDEIKDFLLIQLQYVAGDESIETAAQYLGNERLADAAARLLVRIGSDAAGKALLTALNKARTPQQVTQVDKNSYDLIRPPVVAQHFTLIQALGDMRYQPAVDAIGALIADSPGYRKVMLHSLAQIADPSSEKLMLQCAESAGYKYEFTDALNSYLLFLKNSLPAQANRVASSAQKMLNATSETSQIAAKSAALELLTLSAGEKAIGNITDALKSDSKQYRQAALNYSANIKTSKMYDELMKTANKEKRPEVKAEIITFLAATGNKNALPFVLSALKDKDPEVVAASLTTAGKLGGEKAVTPIIETMKNGTQQSVVDAGKNALLTIKSGKIADEAAKGISGASVPATVAFMDVLAQKNATGYANRIFPLATSNNPQIAAAACGALKYVATEKDLSKLSGLLTQVSGQEQIKAVQIALYSAVRYSGNNEKQTELILDQMKNSNNKTLFYKPLSMIGGEKALNVVSEGFNSSDKKTKNAAFDALTEWNGGESYRELYAICKNDPSGIYFDKALTSYINQIIPSQNTNAQKLILLRNALEIARTPAQKETIIALTTITGTFPGLITTGKLMDDPNENVQQAAVQAVITIALAHPEYYGKVVTELLNKAMQLNKNPEASYQQQAIRKHLAELPQDDGFVSMFNGKDLTGWKGLVENPIARSKMKPAELAEKQKKADEIMLRDWIVENGLLVFIGKGYENLCSEKMYGDFELYIDWRIDPDADSGIYLRGSPQVQIWDIANPKATEVGSGGLFNNEKYPSKPLAIADNPAREWNSFYIRMEGDKVTVYLNGRLVTDHTILENYWDRSLPIFTEDAIELQAHTTRIEFRDIYVREIPRPKAYQVSEAEKKEGFVPMFNGINMTGWIGNLNDYYAKDGMIICDPERGGHGNLYTEKEYSDFEIRFEFLLTPAANNGLGIRAPLTGDAAYAGMELQILDNEAEVYKDLHPYQYHGSVYGVIPAKRGYLKPVGEWNYQEVIAKGNRITITLNGTVILDGDLAEASNNFTSTMDGNNHPGLSNKQGHIGFLGHGSWVAFKNLRIKELKK
jgi:HEAT repeat protein